jgi:hypothetical protein
MEAISFTCPVWFFSWQILALPFAFRHRWPGVSLFQTGNTRREAQASEHLRFFAISFTR